jgi:hypothetical protein
VRDGLAAGHFSRSAFGVDVNPLVVGRGFSELVDSVLVDDGPFGHADLDAFEHLGVIYATDDVQTRSPPRESSTRTSDT